MANAETVLRAAREAALSKATETAQRNAVQRILAHYGWLGLPEIFEGFGPGGAVIRNYVFQNTPAGDLVLATGPSYEPLVRVLGRDDWEESGPGLFMELGTSRSLGKIHGSLTTVATRAAARDARREVGKPRGTARRHPARDGRQTSMEMPARSTPMALEPPRPSAAAPQGWYETPSPEIVRRPVSRTVPFDIVRGFPEKTVETLSPDATGISWHAEIQIPDYPTGRHTKAKARFYANKKKRTGRGGTGLWQVCREIARGTGWAAPKCTLGADAVGLGYAADNGDVVMLRDVGGELFVASIGSTKDRKVPANMLDVYAVGVESTMVQVGGVSDVPPVDAEIEAAEEVEEIEEIEAAAAPVSAAPVWVDVGNYQIAQPANGEALLIVMPIEASSSDYAPRWGAVTLALRADAGSPTFHTTAAGSPEAAKAELAKDARRWWTEWTTPRYDAATVSQLLTERKLGYYVVPAGSVDDLIEIARTMEPAGKGLDLLRVVDTLRPDAVRTDAQRHHQSAIRREITDRDTARLKAAAAAEAAEHDAELLAKIADGSSYYHRVWGIRANITVKIAKSDYRAAPARAVVVSAPDTGPRGRVIGRWAVFGPYNQPAAVVAVGELLQALRAGKGIDAIVADAGNEWDMSERDAQDAVAAALNQPIPAEGEVSEEEAEEAIEAVEEIAAKPRKPRKPRAPAKAATPIRALWEHVAATAPTRPDSTWTAIAVTRGQTLTGFINAGTFDRDHWKMGKDKTNTVYHYDWMSNKPVPTDYADLSFNVYYSSGGVGSGTYEARGGGLRDREISAWDSQKIMEMLGAGRHIQEQYGYPTKQSRTLKYEQTVEYPKNDDGPGTEIVLRDGAPVEAEPSNVVPFPSGEVVDAAAGKTYRYAATIRPPGFGGAPAGFLSFESHPEFRHGVVVYPHKLPPDQVEHYSLLWMPASTAVEEIADEVAADIDYPAETLKLAEDDPRYFVQSIGQYLDKLHVWVDGGREAFAPLVLARLKRIVASGEVVEIDADEAIEEYAELAEVADTLTDDEVEDVLVERADLLDALEETDDEDEAEAIEDVIDAQEAVLEAAGVDLESVEEVSGTVSVPLHRYDIGKGRLGWWKTVKAIDRSKRGGYAILGDFIDFPYKKNDVTVDLPVGTVLIHTWPDTGKNTGKKWTDAYVVDPSAPKSLRVLAEHQVLASADLHDVLERISK